MNFEYRAGWRFSFTICLVSLVVFLGSCSPPAAPTFEVPTETLLPPTFTPTPTILWFPPTATYTPSPLSSQPISSTLGTQPAYGDVLISDNFSDPAVWTLGESNEGSAALGDKELTLAIHKDRAYLFSIRSQAMLGDFFAEITASPNICRGKDEYGLLLRMASLNDFYRFSLSCDGKARVDRVSHGQATTPIPAIPNGNIPPGAPSVSRLGVWALGKEMRFYVNGEYIFTLRDPTIISGGIGVFARASGPEDVSVNFSDLVVYKTMK